MRHPSFDQQAVTLLLADDQQGLTRLAEQARRVLHNQAECPDCGHDGEQEDNGSDTLCCTKCGCHFEVP